MIGKFSSQCDELGPVERWFCMDCSSKILSIPLPFNPDKDSSTTDSKKQQKEETAIPKCLVNLGPVVEEEIPPAKTSLWKEQLEQIENNLHLDKANGVWVRARPEYDLDLFDSSLTWSGGCSCGACRYEFALNHPTELQHCYCHLCRTLSGSPFMTWIPVEKKDFRWKTTKMENEEGKLSSPSSLEIVRTTPFGRRHICRNCKSVMTIVYDEQPDHIWPCAGSLDDSSLPKDTTEMGKYLSRVCHICCRYHPTWLKVRDDGLERIEEAC
jgi:hypothetical protein